MSDGAEHPWRVLVFVKAPRPGEVKTRLARALGATTAAGLYRRLAEWLLQETRDPDGRWSQLVCFQPPEARSEISAWLGDRAAVAAQRGADLGERMHHAFERALESGASRVVLVGSDIPGLSRELLADAFSALRANDVVLGPAADAGYYLIGLRAPCAALFEGIEWSGPHVLEQTLERAAAEQLSVARLARLRDVDTPEDLRAEWPRLRPLLEGWPERARIEALLDSLDADRSGGGPGGSAVSKHGR